MPPPFTIPYFSIAWYPYSEQDGTNRQLDGRTLDNVA
jgi:hypothetical protein